jgi:predicted permease
LIRLSRVDTGLDAEQVLTMQVTQLTGAESRDAATSAAGRQRFDEMRRALAALPGVIAVGVGSTLPLRTSGFVNDVKVEGRPLVAGQPPARAEQRSADASYFRAAGIPLLRGRMFTTSDESSNAGLSALQRDGVMGAGAAVAIINKAYADRVFPNEDPIGKQVAWTGQIVRELYPSMEKELMTIVGVVGNTRDGERLDAEPVPTLYSPVDHVPSGGGFVLRASSNVSALAASATRIVRRIAPTALIEDVVTIQEYKDRSISNQRLNAALISAFGALALVVAAVGIGGVLAFSVSARTNEIGIRMSLGADRGIIERMILREGGRLVVIGLLLGLTGAVFAGRVVRGMLFGISPNDPVTLVTAALAMAAIGVVTCWVPALRAARVDPVITMRAQ